MMDTHIADLAASLPEDLLEPEGAEAELARVLADLASRPVPTGRIHRAWSLGTLSARIAAGWMVTFVRGAFAGEEERVRRSNETRLRAAVAILGRMGYLRGAVMKVGQLLANYPDLVPEQLAQMLSRLHFEAPPMHYALLAEQVRRELGVEPEELFANFEREAFAAASLGQVHRARSRDGHELAVKIQYPGIGRTIRSDFRNLSVLCAPMLLGADRDSLAAQYAYVRDMLLLEIDYESEAHFLERARTALADMEDVVVPRVYRDLSTAKLISMERLEGLHLSEWLETNPDQTERDRIGALLMRATTRLFFSERLCWGDPHPGNVMVLNDGRLGLLDFGSCRAFDDHEWKLVTLGVEGYRHGGEKLREAIRAACELSPEQAADPERMRFLEAYTLWYWEPMEAEEMGDGMFDFGDADYIKRGMKLFGETTKRRYTRSHPMNLYNARFLYGVRVLSHLMRARIPVGRIMTEELARAGIGAG